MSTVNHHNQLHKHFLVGGNRYDDDDSHEEPGGRYCVSTSHPLPHQNPQPQLCSLPLNHAPMKEWLNKCILLQRSGVEDADPWPTAYERLTETDGSPYTPQAAYSVDVAAVAALACATLRTVPSVSTVSTSPCKYPTHNNATRSETLTAIGSSLSGCSTDLSIPDSYSPYYGQLSYERRPSNWLHRSLDSFLQFLTQYIPLISTTIAAVLLFLLLLYLRPVLGQHRRLVVAHKPTSPTVIDASSTLLLRPPLQSHSFSFHDLSIDLSHAANSNPSDHIHDSADKNTSPSQRRLDGLRPEDASDNNPQPFNEADDQSKVHLPHLSQDQENTGKDGINGALQAAAQEHAFARWDLALMVLLLSYILCSYALERLPFTCLHESAVSVILGILVGLLVVNQSATVRFDFDLFNYIILPPIIFGAGFTLKKRMFYRFFGYVSSFGIFLTLILFMLLAYCLEFVHNHISPFITVDGQSIIGLNFEAFLVLAAVLCCSDTVAAVTAIKSDLFPAAHAVVFGEGVMNDVVSIILSQSLIGVAQMRLQGAVVELPTSQLISELVVDVGYYLVTSSIVGAAFGLFISYSFKRYHRILNADPVRAVSLIFVGSYLSYIVSEILGFSAILSIFVCGVCTGHYAYHSLTPTGRVLSTKSASLLSFVAEAFVFGYFGVAASSVVRHPEVFSLSLICWIAFLIPFCRCLATPVVYLFICILKGEFRLSLNNQDKLLVLLGGMMRGTVSYALIIQYVQQACPNSPLGMVLTSTVLGVVLSNVVFFGVALPLLSHWLSNKAKHGGLANDHEISVINDARHLVCLALDSMHHHTKADQQILLTHEAHPSSEDDVSTASPASTEPLLALSQPLLEMVDTPAPLEDFSPPSHTPPCRLPTDSHDASSGRHCCQLTSSQAACQVADKAGPLKPPSATVLGIPPMHQYEGGNRTLDATSSSSMTYKMCGTSSNVRRRAVKHHDNPATPSSTVMLNNGGFSCRNNGNRYSDYLDQTTFMTPKLRDWTADDAQLIGETILRSLTMDTSTHLDGLTKELRHTFASFVEDDPLNALALRDRSAGDRSSSESAYYYTPPHFRESKAESNNNEQEDPSRSSMTCGHQVVAWNIDDDQDTTPASPQSNASTAMNNNPIPSSFNITTIRHNGSEGTANTPEALFNVRPSFWSFANYRPQVVRKGVDRLWHRFDQRYMRPTFGGKVEMDERMDWTQTHRQTNHNNKMTADKVERYHTLLKEVLVSDPQ